MRFIKKNVKNLGSGQFRGSRTALWLRRCPVPSPPGRPCCVCPGGGCFLLPFRFGPFLKAEGNRLDVPDCSMNSSQAPQTMLHWRDKRFPSALRNGSKSSKASENTRSPGQAQQGHPGGDGTGQRQSIKPSGFPGTARRL